MWQNPTPKAKANLAAKKRQRERYRRPLHIKRLEAKLQLVESDGTASQVSGRCVLNDLSPKGIGVLTHEFHAEGTQVILTIPEPRETKVKGRAVWCQKNQVSSRIISQDSFAYRMGIQFVFDNDEERIKFEQFCDELFKHYLGFLPPDVAQKVQAQASQGDPPPAAASEEAPAAEGEETPPSDDNPLGGGEGSGEGSGEDGGNPPA